MKTETSKALNFRSRIMSAASILPSPDRIAKAMKRAALRIPFMDDVLAMYYCAVDPSTPGKTRLAIGATLLYLVLPLDIIPDFLPIIGYTDDATALMILLRFVSSHVTDRHKQLAKARLTTALGEDETESNAAA